MGENERCPQCDRGLDGPSRRLVQDACGHKKCRLCLLDDEVKCRLCQEPPTTEKRRVGHTAVITCQGRACDETVERDEGEPPRRSYSHLVIPSHVVVNDEGYTCTVCGKTFTTRPHVRYHLYCAGGKKPFECKVCSKQFVVRSHLETHKLSHEERRPYACDRCDKSFMERSKLKRHRFVHADVRSFACPDCGKSFKNKENLRTHRLTHAGQKPYACVECGARFNHSSNLKKHLQTHSAERSHMCDHCGKRFKLKWALTVHRRGHSKQRPNECSTCSKTFVHLRDLQRHELIHLDAKGYTCGICGTEFKRKDNLNRHTKNTHPGKKPLVIKNIVKKKPAVVDNPNAINVITAPPAKEPEKKEVISFINVPLKLAFKTPAFKNNYNIHRDYVEPKELNPVEPVNIYEKILLPSSPTPIVDDVYRENDVPMSVCERILAPFSAPAHYETSFDNKTHAVIKNIKFKLPAKYTNLKDNERPLLDDEKTYTELKNVSSATSVIVNSSSNNYNELHWRRRTAQYLSSK